LEFFGSHSTHLSLDKDCPDPRPIMPRRIGKVIAIPQVGGLHHRYERLAA
jgi:putative transposase